MVGFIKKFKSFFPSVITFVIITILALFAVYRTVDGAIFNNFIDFLAFLRDFFPIILVASAAIFLQAKNRSLPAHLVLLLGVIFYANAGSNFIRALLSFSFSNFEFAVNPFTVNMLVGVLIFLYLGFYILSCLFALEDKPEVKSSAVWGSVILAFSYFYFRFGLQSAMIIILPAFVALLFGSQVATVLLLIAGVVSVPFEVIIEILDGNILAQPFSYWIFTAFAVLLLVLGVKGLIGLLKKKSN
jgi:hypothetical protein